MTFEYLRAGAKSTGLRARLMAVVAEGDRARVYLTPPPDHQDLALSADPQDAPETNLPEKALGFRVQAYAMTKWRDLFTDRQLVALITFSDLVSEAREQVRRDAVAAGLSDDGVPVRDGGLGATGYAQAVSLYLALALGKASDGSSTIAWWQNIADKIAPTFSRHAIPMVWDFAEVNLFSDSTRNWNGNVLLLAKAIETLPYRGPKGVAYQLDAAAGQEYGVDQATSVATVVSTDPPYYDNISYADLSDFFYVWLRHTLLPVLPEQFATLSVPKSEEIIASPERAGSRERAEEFFLEGMTRAMRSIARHAHPAVPVTIYYAFKQAESRGKDPVGSTGWETFLGAVMESGLVVSGTWPVRTERPGRIRDVASNALASSVVLVCRPQPSNALTATRREFQDQLRNEFPAALVHLQRSNIAPVDLAQASIGPGMRIFTEYREVLNADGSAMTVREALALINATLDEVLAEQEGDFDSDTRWALTWSEQHGFDEGEYGDAEQLSKAKNTSADGLVQAGVIESRRGKVRLLHASELNPDWDPATDHRPTVWEMTHHLIRLLESGGEEDAAELAARLGAQAETARDLAYRLYVVSDRKKRAEDARQYNGLVQSWSEIMRLAQLPSTRARQAGLEFAEE